MNEKMQYISRESDFIKKNSMNIPELNAIFEINTGAISRGYRTTPYPSEEMIDYIARSKKPFAICSDTHSTSSIACNLEYERQKLENKGYTYIKSLDEILK